MAETSWPSAAPATITEHDHERLWSAFYANGLVGDPSLTSLIFADSTGLQVKARANRLARVRGFEWSSGPTDVTVPIAANASGSTRLDRVVLELDKTTWTLRLAVIEGTPGGSFPAVTQDAGPAGVWQHEIANVTVINGAATINSGDVSPRNTYLGPSLLVANNGDLTNDLPRQFLRYMPDSDRLDLHTQGESSAGRRTLWEDSGEIDINSDASSSVWSVSTAAVIRRINNVVSLRYGSVERIGGSLSEGVNSSLPGIIPSSMRDPGRDQYATVRVSNHLAGRVTIVRGSASTNFPGRIMLVDHPTISPGHFVSGFTLTWLVP